MKPLAFLLTLLLAAPTLAQETIVVAPDGVVTSVAEAVRQAPRGAHIVVEAGVYAEPPLVVDKPVTLEGHGEVILDGQGEHQILTITADRVTVRGLHFRNVGTSFVEDRAAVKVDDARHCVIEGNRFTDTFFAIYLAKTADCRITDNEIQGSTASESRSGNGIHLWYSKNITVEYNTVRGHRDGIYFEFVEDSKVTGNISEHNLRYGLHFMFSDRCVYRDNAFLANDAGVAVMYTKRVTMTGNRFEDNDGPAAFGLLLKDITDSRIEANRFARNTVALYAEGSNRVAVTANDFIANGWAVKIMANALDNAFSANNFVANTFDVATNSRQHYSIFAGNYWDQYEGYDLDRDGVGDVPFRPVRLFAFLVERNEPAILLLHSVFVDLLDAAERVIPALTPEALIDEAPVMRRLLRNP